MSDQKNVPKPWSVRFAIFCVLVVAMVYFPTTVLFCGCMLPAFVAALVDTQGQRTAGMTVGAVNLAGTLPAGLALWGNGGRIEHAIALLLQPQTLLVAYVAAAFGWALYFYIPPIVAGMMVRRNEKRLKDIEKRQQDLVRKWGAGIAGQKS